MPQGQGRGNPTAARVVVKAGEPAASAQAQQALMQVDRLIICVFLEKDENIYRERLPYYFPVGRCLLPPPHSRQPLSRPVHPGQALTVLCLPA